MHDPNVRIALVKLLVASMILAGLVISCFFDSAGGLKGLVIFFIIVLAFPVTLLIGIDASRTIKREMPAHKSLRMLGRLLAFPQAILGTVLVGFSLVYPVLGVRELVHDVSNGKTPILALAGLFVAALSFGLGLHYVREGLGISMRAR
jgi:hypothetical protein